MCRMMTGRMGICAPRRHLAILESREGDALSDLQAGCGDDAGQSLPPVLLGAMPDG
jgi:hypothetical protein